MKTLLAVLLCASVGLAAQLTAHAQSFTWVKQAEATENGYGNGVAVDGTGNVYVTGYFTGTATFESGGSISITSATTVIAYQTFHVGNAYLVKYNSSGTAQWAYNIGSTSDGSQAYDLALDSSGNIYVVGEFSGTMTAGHGSSTQTLTSSGQEDAFIAKFNSSGTLQWAVSGTGSTGHDTAYGVGTDASGNVYVTGTFEDTSVTFGSTSITGAGSEDFFLVKLNSSGTVQWAVAEGGTSREQGRGLDVDGSSIFVTGFFTTNANFSGTTIKNQSQGAFLAEYSDAGVMQWVKAGRGPDDDYAFSVSTNGSILATTGTFDDKFTWNKDTSTEMTSYNGADYFLVCHNTSGTVDWVRRGSSSANGDYGYATDVDASGNIYATGRFASSAGMEFVGAGVTIISTDGSIDGFVAMYDNIGTLQWGIGFGGGGSSEDLGLDIAYDANSGALYVVGKIHTNGGVSPANFDGTSVSTLGNQDMFLTKMSTTALPVELTSFDALADAQDVTLRWSTASETNNAGFEVQQAICEGDACTWNVQTFVTGHGTTLNTQSYRHTLSGLLPGQHRFRLKQIDYDGTFDYSPEVEVAIESPLALLLDAVYPNPFSDRAMVSFAVQETSVIDVAVFDLLGRRVETLHSGIAEAHRSYRVAFDGFALASGVYVVRMEGPRGVRTKKVMVQR